MAGALRQVPSGVRVAAAALVVVILETAAGALRTVVVTHGPGALLFRLWILALAGVWVIICTSCLEGLLKGRRRFVLATAALFGLLVLAGASLLGRGHPVSAVLVGVLSPPGLAGLASPSTLRWYRQQPKPPATPRLR